MSTDTIVYCDRCGKKIYEGSEYLNNHKVYKVSTSVGDGVAGRYLFKKEICRTCYTKIIDKIKKAYG